MAFLHILTITTLAALAAASPLAKRQSIGYELKVAIPADTAINANGAAFWTGKKTKTFCAEQPSSECGGFPNVTTIYVDSSGGASMYAEVPGGQDIYIAPSGALSFTEPHTEGVFPTGSITTGFSIVADGERLLFKQSSTKSPGWALCGTEGQVFALIPGAECAEPKTVIGIFAEGVSELGAFQYE